MNSNFGYCLECGAPLSDAGPSATGRSAKKFCSPSHRNAWHGRRRATLRSLGRQEARSLERPHDCARCDKPIPAFEEHWVELLEDREGRQLMLRMHLTCEAGQ